MGTSEEMGKIVAFLASDDASFVSGHSLLADGGYHGNLKRLDHNNRSEMVMTLPKTMRAVETRSVGLADLHLVERPVPQPGPDDVLIRVRAASLNYRDVVLLKGIYKQNMIFPFVPISDASGDVVAAGERVTRFKVGDKVLPTFIQGWISGTPAPERRTSWTLGYPRTGVLQDYIVVPADDAVGKPVNLSYLEGATLPIAGLTAWSALTQGGLMPGDWVLVEGTGGVALLALQFAKALGAKVVVITSSDDKIGRVQSLGADAAVNYRTTPQWSKAVRERTGGQGVNVVVESAGSTISQAIESLAFGGFIGVVGFLGGFDAKVLIVPLIEKLVRLQGIAVGSREQFEAMNRMIDTKGVQPVISEVMPLTNASEALRLMERRGHFGKICLSFDE
jgi:NADPH:quinone reductase-like Zn-dependent oxidoreductase